MRRKERFQETSIKQGEQVQKGAMGNFLVLESFILCFWGIGGKLRKRRRTSLLCLKKCCS